MHHSDDVDTAEINRTGYVEDDFSVKSETIDTSSDSTVVPMMSSGVVDVNCSDLSTSEIKTNLSSRYRSDRVPRNGDNESMPFELG